MADVTNSDMEKKLADELAAEMDGLHDDDDDDDDDAELDDEDEQTVAEPDGDATVNGPKGKKKKGTRKKKIVYPAPEEGLTWPFSAELPELTYAFTKVPEDKFQTTDAFNRYKCYGYLQLCVDHLRRQFDEKIAGYLAEQMELRVKIEDADKICSALNIAEGESKEQVTDILAAAASAKDLSLETMLAAVEMLFENRKEKGAE